MRTLTMKFGGTSVGDAAALSQAAEIVLDSAQEWGRLVVVVSAAGAAKDYPVCRSEHRDKEPEIHRKPVHPEATDL